MAKTATSLATPALIAWGRTSMGYAVEDVADRLGVKPDRVKEWEAGADAPSVAQLKAMAQLYRRPLGAFYLAAPPVDFSVPKDHRRLPNEDAKPVSPQLAAEIRRAYEQREAAIDLEEGEQQNAAFKVPLKGATSPEEVADRLRQFLGITVSDQSSWRDQYKAFNGWRDAIEQAGVMVLQASRIELQEMRGMALHFPHIPVILLNRADLPRGRLFSLLHEVAHLALGTEGLCDPMAGDASEIEVFCNAVAAATLMPPVALMEHPLVKPKPNYSEQWEDLVLRRLSLEFGASEEAVLRRLLSLSKTTERFYRKKRQEYLARYQQVLQQDNDAQVPQSQKKIGELGPRFTRLVLAALDRQSINLNEASGYMDTKVRHIDSIRAALGS